MTLTVAQANRILVEVLRKQPPTITGPEADALRAKFKAEVDEMEKDGKVRSIALPGELE